MIYMVAIFCQGCNASLGSKTRLNHMRLSMMEIKGCSHEASSFLFEMYSDGTFIITELYSVLERV